MWTSEWPDRKLWYDEARAKDFGSCIIKTWTIESLAKRGDGILPPPQPLDSFSTVGWESTKESLNRGFDLSLVPRVWDRKQVAEKLDVS